MADSSLRSLDTIDAQRGLVMGLERLGWSISSVEIDLMKVTARVELRRGDLLVTLDARNGKATTTRERIRTETVLVGRRGDRCPVERLRTEFLGRAHHEGLRSGLRWLSSYVADNSTVQIPASGVRALFAPLMCAS